MKKLNYLSRYLGMYKKADLSGYVFNKAMANPETSGAILGGALGFGGGSLLTYLLRRNSKNRLRDALIGGGLTGLAGAFAGHNYGRPLRNMYWDTYVDTLSDKIDSPIPEGNYTSLDGLKAKALHAGISAARWLGKNSPDSYRDAVFNRMADMEYQLWKQQGLPSDNTKSSSVKYASLLKI